MFQRNETQDFIEGVFIDEDHLFVMPEERKLDEFGAGHIRRKKFVDFQVEVARIRKEKEIAQAEKLKEDTERLSKVVIITETKEIYDLTVVKLGEQIDAIRFRGMPDVPAKSRYPKKADRQEALKGIFERYNVFLVEKGPHFAVSFSNEIEPAVERE